MFNFLKITKHHSSSYFLCIQHNINVMMEISINQLVAECFAMYVQNIENSVKNFTQFLKPALT